MRPAIDDDAPPIGEGRIVVVGLESHPVAHRSAVQLGALGSSEDHRLASSGEVDREDFGLPVRIVTNRPNDMLDSKLQHSSSLSTVTASWSADMIQPNAMGISARSDAMTDECRPSHRTARRSSAGCYCWCSAGRASTEAFGRKAA